jgi:hypothetical protein
VADGGLKELTGLKQLSELALSLTKVIDAAKEELSRSLSRCRIFK